MTLLLVTGAGATRELGVGDAKMPLMRDWSTALCSALDEREPGLARACHLEKDMEAPDFEESLGLLLRWSQTREAERRFQGLTAKQVGNPFDRFDEIWNRVSNRLAVVTETLKETLFQQFGQRNIDATKAAKAYGSFLAAIGGQPGDSGLIVATTNYDRAAEAGLRKLGFQVETGIRADGEVTPTLNPVGLVENRGSATPVIHLHGAVGWYQLDKAVHDHYADRDFNETLGDPVVLFPDREKDPTSHTIVKDLWAEFDVAVSVADAIIVIGHSLHDPALVRALCNVPKKTPVLISHVESGDAERITDEVRTAVPVQLEFGPEIKGDLSSLVRGLPST